VTSELQFKLDESRLHIYSSLTLYERWLDSELVKLVFPFDSPTTILPLATIAIILVFYTLLLIKLKPSQEEIEMTENNSVKLENPRKPAVQTEAIGNASEEIMSTVEEKPAETIEIEADTENIGVKETKNNKDRESKKAFFLFGERDFEGCPHKFGYLKSLRKNAPIPDECFGCPQILECLMTRKSK
jgi:hypothetical protein